MGVIDGHVIGPFLRFPRMLAGGPYLNFLQNDLPILLEDVPLNLRHQMIFQHDGAPPHFSLAVRRYLDETFPVWIGRSDCSFAIFSVDSKRIIEFRGFKEQNAARSNHDQQDAENVNTSQDDTDAINTVSESEASNSEVKYNFIS
ncbi:hypothetical protein NQ318_018266 [Aromia moschata]|uniref:Transposase n=1 Tax=Aromia moschata TaxID=1265417 RepID=A0AAV8ZFX8_9CUCU|nr:hypothetical protein NQ318_018266 [Aromia moschata]